MLLASSSDIQYEEGDELREWEGNEGPALRTARGLPRRSGIEAVVTTLVGACHLAALVRYSV